MVSAPTKPEIVTEVAVPQLEGGPLVIQFPPGVLDDDLFLAIAELNDDWHFERNCQGGLELSPPPGSLSGHRGIRIASQLVDWSDSGGSGMCFGAGSGFSLAIGSARDPDAAWVSNDRLQDVVTDDEGLWKVCPDLIVEVRSKGQTIRKQQEKMHEWMRAGARLGWLIDVYTDDGVVWIYRVGPSEPERAARSSTLSGEDVAEGLTVDLTRVWR